MIEVRLHGSLAQEFGRIWHLDIKTPAEAVRAIECARHGFKAAILKLGELGFVFRVRSKTHDYDNDDVGTTLGSTDRIDIIPIVRGASAGIRFVVGAVMVVASGVLTAASFGALSGPAALMASAGIGLMIGSVIEWLTPKPKRPDNTTDGMQSWTFNGPTNTTEEGVPVPVIYGEVLTGAVPVSAGITVSESSNGYSADGVTIGGNLDLNASYESAGMHTQTFVLSASVTGGRYPTSYSWSHSGFPLAVAARWVQQGAVAKLELDYDVPPGPGRIDTGTIGVDVDTFRNYGMAENETQTLSTAVAATVYNRAPV